MVCRIFYCYVSTGLGEVASGDTVGGLRRAFVVAGSKSQVMSLWSVPALATC